MTPAQYPGTPPDTSAGAAPPCSFDPIGQDPGAHSSKLTVSCSHSFSQSDDVPYVCAQGMLRSRSSWSARRRKRTTPRSWRLGTAGMVRINSALDLVLLLCQC